MIRSHHFSAILPVVPAAYDWTKADFLTLLKQTVEQAGLRPVGELAFTYEPQGISAIVLLEESHVALHFWTEAGKITVDIHVCDYQHDNYAKAEKLAAGLTQQLSSVCDRRLWHYACLTG